MPRLQPVPAPAPLPAVPPAPPVPPTGVPGFVVPGPGGPVLLQDPGALRARQSEIAHQLRSATSRRLELAREIRRSEPGGADRAGLEARIQLLDQRIMVLESDLGEVGRQIAVASALGARPGMSGRGPRRDGPPRDRTPLALVLTFFLLAPLILAASRRMWRGGGRFHAAPPVDQETRERLARLETAVDAIAIEMERVAEGQRFVTRLLAESAAMQPMVVDAAHGDRARASLERGDG